MNVFSMGQAMGDAQKLAGNTMAIQREQAVRQNAGNAFAGDQKAINALATYDPQLAQGMDTRRKQALGEFARAATWVEQGQTPEEKARRWDMSVEHLSGQYPQLAGEKGKYSPEQTQMIMGLYAQAQDPGKLVQVQAPDGTIRYMYESEARGMQAPPKSPMVQVNTGGPTTPGAKKYDETFAPIAVEWEAAGGFADVQKNLNQLQGAINRLRSGDVQTGPVRGVVPDAVKSVTDPELLAVKQDVEEVVQRNLRLILGAQFTEKEGQALISRAFDPRLPTQENIQRLNRLMRQIQTAAQAKQESVQYFKQNGTLQGFEGKTYSASDFSPEAMGFTDPQDSGPDQQGQSGAGMSPDQMSDDEIRKQLGL